MTTHAPATLSTPMPTPGSPNAPYFKGDRVTDFLDSLEAHGKAAYIPNDELPSYVLRYVHRKVRNIIESAPHWTTQDWSAARTYLTDLYGSNDHKPRINPDRLRKWVGLHAENRIFVKLKDVDRYYREFTAQSTPLLAAQRITQNDANLLFYRGIPSTMRKKIKRKIPTTHQTSTAAPSIGSVLGYLRAHFDEDDLDINDDDVELSLESEEDDQTSDSDDEDFSTRPPRKQQKKKTKFEVKEVPGAPPVQPPAPTDIETLTRQMEDLRLGHARQLDDIQRGQAMLLRELSAVRSMGMQGSSRYNGIGPAAQNSPERRCFICDEIHKVGVQNCAEAVRLTDEGLAKFTPGGRLTRPDGSDLPRAPINGGGVSRALREERRISESLKGKAGEKRDSPPHMAHYASLQTGGEDFFVKDIFAISSSSPTAFPVTRSQAKDPRFDPTKGNRPNRRANEESDHVTPPTRRRPQNQTAPQASTSQPTIQTVPNVIHDPPQQQQQSKPQPETTQRPQRPSPSQPEAPPPRVRPPIPKPVPRPASAEQPPLQPHPSNTEEAWRSRKTVPNQNSTAPTAQRDDVEMRDGMRPPQKATGGYHFTSTVQDMVDGDVVQAKILETLITLPLKEIIGISADLQKRFAGLTKTRREYSTKTVIAEPMDDHYENDSAYITELFEDGEDGHECNYEDEQESTYSTVHLSYGKDEDLDSVLLRYSSAVKVVASPLFAMTTGRFGGTIAGQDVTFMVDSGSELNLMSEDLHGRTGVPIDLDGARWSLKGINGGAVPLVGCCREVPVSIGGHRFDHHFFVNSETGKQDVILGQPWLQWYTAALLYSRSGAVEMKVWKAGDRESGERPTISIRLCAANAPRNSDQLVMKGKKATVEDYASDLEN
jgi:hypothetical protein